MSLSLSLESLLPPLLQSDGVYRFLRGKDSELQSLRAGINININANASVSVNNTQTTITNTNNGDNEDNEEEEEEKILYHLKSASVTIQNAPNAFEKTVGQLLITTKRLFFIANTNVNANNVNINTNDDTNVNANDDMNIEKDFSIDAQCISLHAMMSEPDCSVYCQLADDHDYDGDHNNGNDDDEEYLGPAEIFFYPQQPADINTDTNTDTHTHTHTHTHTSTSTKKEVCTELFESFCKLINLNPVFDDDDNDNNNGTGAGGLAAMLGMMSNSYYDDDNDNDGDMIYRIDPNQMVTAWDEKSQEEDDGVTQMQSQTVTQTEVTSDARSRMLEHLDNILVVPPEYEVDGQFDDADDDEDNDDADKDDNDAGDEDMNDIL